MADDGDVIQPIRDGASFDGVMIVCGGASICDWNGHSWSDCDHDEGAACNCAEGPCRYCRQTHEQAAARSIEFMRELDEGRRG